MVVYIPLIFPATWCLNKYGLRKSLIIGSFGNFIGAAIKCFSLAQDRFWVALVGQAFSAVSQIFVLNIPPILSAIWFPNDEIARATGVGVFGNLLGVIIGFAVPSYLVKEGPPSEVSSQLTYVVITTAIVTAVIFVAILICFTDKPELPPSYAQIKDSTMQVSYMQSLKAIYTNRNFNLLFLCYGVVCGGIYAISTVMNQIVVQVYPENSADSGLIGFLATSSALFSASILGYILDKTRAFKAVTVVCTVFCVLSLLGFAGLLKLKIIWPIFLMAFFVGFFMTGYMSIGFEYGAELTYPEPEGTSAGLLNVSAQIFGIILTITMSTLIDSQGSFWAVLLLAIVLSNGVILSLLTKPDLKRQRAEQDRIGDRPQYSNYQEHVETHQPIDA